MTDGQSALPPGNHTAGRDYEEDQQNDGEILWMSVGMKPPGREQHKMITRTVYNNTQSGTQHVKEGKLNPTLHCHGGAQFPGTAVPGAEDVGRKAIWSTKHVALTLVHET